MAVVWTADADAQWDDGAPGGIQFITATLSTAAGLAATINGSSTQFITATLASTPVLTATVNGSSTQLITANLATTSGLSASITGSTGPQFITANLSTVSGLSATLRQNSTQFITATLSTAAGVSATVSQSTTQFITATLPTPAGLSATVDQRTTNQFITATLASNPVLTATVSQTNGQSSVKIIAVGDLSAAGGAGTVKAQIAAYYADSQCAFFHTIGDNVYEGSQPSQWTSNPVPYDGLVLRGGAAASNQWVFPGTGHHDWGDSGTAGAAEAGATVHSPADGLKPYFDSVHAGLQYGDGAWTAGTAGYYYQDLAAASWRVIHLSGSTHAAGAAGPVGTDNNPLVPLGGGDVTNKALTSNVATITLTANHGILATDTITVALNPADPVFDGTHAVTGVSGNNVTFAKVHANVTSAATGGMAGTAQYTWFAARLDECVAGSLTPLVMWSDPYFATTDDHHPSEPTVYPFWHLLSQKVPGNALVLNSHKHNYERTDQMMADGTVDSTNGIVQIVVGSGGNGHYSFTGSPASWSLFRDSTHYGVLELVLSAGQVVYTWKNAANGNALDGPTTLTLGGGGPPPSGTILYGATTPGMGVLTPSTRTNLVHIYNTGSLAQALALPSTTGICLTATADMQQGTHRADLRAATSSSDAICVHYQNYWGQLPDRPYTYANPYHEPDNGDKNPDGTYITGAQIIAELEACINYVKPVVNHGRQHPVLFGSIFTGQFFYTRTPNNSPTGGGGNVQPGGQDVWISSMSDWLGADLYQDTRTVTNAAAAATRNGIPMWFHPEVGTSVAQNPPDSRATQPAHLQHMQTLVGMWTTMAFPPFGACWYDQNHNILDATLVSHTSNTITVSGIPGKPSNPPQTTDYSMANGAAIRIVDGQNTETVTLTSAHTQSSSGQATLSVTTIAHSHNAGKTVYLMPLSVDYWNGLS